MISTAEACVDVIVSEFKSVCTHENIKELLEEHSRVELSTKFFTKKTKTYKKLKNIVSKYFYANQNNVYNINEILLRRAFFTFEGLESRSGNNIETLAYRMFQDYILRNVSEETKMQLIKRTTRG